MNSSIFPKIMGQLLGEPRKMIDRKELLKKAGDIVLVQYSGAKKEDCFIIGWLYLMDEDSVHLKITSTRFESYESVSVPIANIISVKQQEMN